MAGLLQISVAVDTEGAEAVCSLFNELNRPVAVPDGTPHAGGSRAVIEATGFSDDADLEPHEVTMDMAQALRVKTFVAPGPEAEALVQRLREGLYWLSRLHPVSEPVVEVIEDKDWQEAWKEHYAAFAVGRSFLIRPAWDEAGAAPAGRHVLRLNPGMAFGTGLHPSTKLCLVLLEGLGLPGARVLDVGTGSGILALGALKLGAARVVATDTDPTALAVVAGKRLLQRRCQGTGRSPGAVRRFLASTCRIRCGRGEHLAPRDRVPAGPGCARFLCGTDRSLNSVGHHR